MYLNPQKAKWKLIRYPIISLMNQSFDSLCRDTLALDNSIRVVAIANKLGTIVAQEYRANLNPYLTREETSQYAIQAVTRVDLREDFMHKLGRFEYSIGKYEKLIRAIIPIDYESQQFYLLLSFDVGSDVIGILQEKVHKFMATKAN
jgi:hypothetical protein